MSRRLRVLLGLLPVLPLLWAGQTRAEERLRLEGKGGSGPIEIHAETLSSSEKGDKLHGEGNVVLVWKGYRLTADRASYDRETDTAEADGSVLLEDENGNLLRAVHLTVNTETQEGVITDGTLTLVREGYRIWGKRFVRTGPQTYLVEDGGFTTCEGTWPSWRVEASRIRVELEKYLVSRNASFWAESAPVVFTPYLVFPVKTERQSGFLIPKVGFSDRSGALLIVPYYWAFSDSADVVLRLEYRSRRGFTEAAEFRYAVAEGHEGTAEVTHSYDRSDENSRYTVKLDHKSRFSETTQARLHVDYLGDTKILRDNGETLEQRGVERLESYAVGAHALEFGNAFVYTDYIEALHQPESETQQLLPSLGLLGRETPLLAGLNFDPTIRYSNFHREEGLRGQRLELHPVLSRGWSLGGIGLAARAGYRGHFYETEGEEIFRGLAQASVTVSALLARTYGTFIHTLEPKLVGLWEGMDRGREVPVFDAADAFGRRTELGLLLENRLLRASDLAPVAGLDVERSLGLAAGEPQLWRIRGSYTPTEKVELRAEGEYDASGSASWRSASATGEYTDARGDKLRLGYHFVEDRASYADAVLSYALTRELALIYRHNYSFSDGATLEEAYALHLTHPCWEVIGAFSRNLRENERYEHRYYVLLTLKGLGKIGSMKGILP